MSDPNSDKHRNLANTILCVMLNDYRINHGDVSRWFDDGSRVFVFNYESVETAFKSWPYHLSGLIGIKSGTWEGCQSLIEQVQAMDPRCDEEVSKAQLDGNVLIIATTGLSDTSATIRAVLCLEHRIPGVFIINTA